jgi:hypothetical protein
MPRNTPLAIGDQNYVAGNRPMLNRKQRKAAEAKERKTGTKSRMTN